ncbi:hypothetical protein MKX03_006100 [Papaver bracteatum]|nr:hypothetical protein MKX03_006100 [Papaver bracteatum]
MEDPTIVEAAEEEITQVVTTNNQEIVVERQFDILQRAIIGELEKWKNYCVEDNQDYKKISQAAEDGDWEKAKELLKTCPEGIDRVISICSETALLVAARNEQWMFVEEIVKLMSPEALELQDSLFGNTGLHYAAGYGKVKLAQLMAKKCPKLTQIRNLEGRVPLEFAVYSVTVGQLETVAYLYSVTTNELPSPFSGREGAAILCTAIQANMYDMALSLVKWFPNLVIMPYMEPKRLRSGICGLEMIIERPFTFLSGARLTWWERCIYSLIEVDMASPFDKMSFEDVNQAEETSRNHIEVSIEEEENPKESSNVSLTSVEHTNSTFISVHLMPYLTRASCIKRLCNKKLTHRRAFALNNLMLAQLNKIMNKDQIYDFFADSSIIQTAIKYGTTEFVAECLKKFPFVMWIEIEGDRMINMAIRERNEKIVNLMCKNTSEKTNLLTRTDKNNSSILHHVAKLAPCSQLNRISGAVLQMQRELQWFKGIENMLPEEYKFMRNNSGETAQTIFTEEHKKLVEKGEKWLKETSGSCMVVAALIATVAFAAAFTVPGGSISDSNSNKNGTPIFLENNSFTLFAAADALALFSSITSVLMFLAILASRYAEEDFLKSLPQKLIIGLATLFLSMATILIAFGAALSIVVWNRFPWAPIPITILSCIPVILFVWLMFPLFVEMVWSTYKPSMFPGLSQHAIMQDNNKKEN